MEKTFSILYANITEKVKRSLSIIGKRSRDDNGNTLFADITLSSAEEVIIRDFTEDAITEIVNEVRRLLQTFSFHTNTSTGIDLKLMLPDDYNTALDTTIGNAIDNFCTDYSLYSWFVITAPRISEKYRAGANAHLQLIVSMLFHRQAAKESELPNPLKPLVEPDDDDVVNPPVAPGGDDVHEISD